MAETAQEWEQERLDALHLLRSKVDAVRLEAKLYESAALTAAADERLQAFCQAAESLRNRIRKNSGVLDSLFEDDFEEVAMGISVFMNLHSKQVLKHDASLCEIIIVITEKLHDDIADYLQADEDEEADE